MNIMKHVTQILHCSNREPWPTNPLWS